MTSPWVPDNVLTTDGKWWMSASSTGKDEWIMHDFGRFVVVYSVHVNAVLGRAGDDLRVQGSVDNQTWDTLHDFVDRDWMKTKTNQTYTASVSGGAYRYIRVISRRTSYLLLDTVQFLGVDA